MLKQQFTFTNLTGWVMQGNGDMTIYVPMGMQVAAADSIKIQHLTGMMITDHWIIDM